MTDPWLAWDIWTAANGGPSALTRRQRDRLAKLVAFARSRSPVYRDLYAGLPGEGFGLASLPPVSKSDLMPAFDRWVTEPGLTYAEVEAFTADGGHIGGLLDGRVAVWKTSGTSGELGLFLHDRFALSVYDTLFAARAWPAMASAAATMGLVGHGWRMACVLAKEDHFAGISSWRHQARAYPWLAPLMRDFSVMTPMPELCRQLSAWDPGQLVAYPSVLSLLASEQEAGRLRIDPAVVIAGGETLDAYEQARIERAFGCRVHNVYACSECDYLAFGCAHGWLHVNADWMILEPVDRYHRPVPPGTASHTVLLTNLANRAQPVIRYDLHDSVTVKPEACACGSPLPAIRVEGRRNQALHFPGDGGGEVAVLPLSIGTVVEQVAGLRRYQLVQTATDVLTLRYQARPEADPDRVARDARAALTGYLADHGAAGVRVAIASAPPRPDPASGKLQSVVPLQERG